MAQTIKIKNSSQALKVPVPGDLAWGEIALNYADGKIYYKKSDATIQSISGGDLASPPAIGGTTPAAGTFTTLIGGADAANYGQLTGGATTKAVQFRTLGTDTNVSMAFQSKGTGAIDLASNVNISNGGTVTALTITGLGGGTYTSIPTNVISVPTTAGGVQATATTRVFAWSTAISAGGTGYTVGDVLTLQGGTFTAQAQATVATVSSGVITSTTNGPANGSYTVTPTNPATTTGGTGTGATVNITSLGVGSLTITNAGSGYVEQPTVTFSNGGGSNAAAYATVGSGTIVKGLGSSLSFYTPGGETLRLVDAGAGTTPWVFTNGLQNNFSSTAKSLAPYIGDTVTTGITFATGMGTGSGIGSSQFRVGHTASAVNYVQVNGAATGTSPIISSQGSDAIISLALKTKGTGSNITPQFDGSIYFQNLSAQNQFRIFNTASAVNYLQTGGSIASSGLALQAAGSDTDIDLALTTKGTGALVVNTGATSAVQFKIADRPLANIYLQATGGIHAVSRTAFGQEGTGSAGFNIYARAGNAIRFQTNGNGTDEQFVVSNTTSAVNYVQVTGGATGAAPTISAQGSDTNAGLNINSKGSGVLIFNRGRDAVNSSSYLFTNVGGLTADASGGSFWRGFHISPINFTIGGANKFPRLAQYFEFDSITDPTYKNVYTSIGNSSDTIEHNFSNETGGGWTFRNSTAFGSDKSFIIAPPLTTDRNYLQVAGASSASSPKLSALGLDTNVSLVVQPKGTGAIDLAAGSSGVNISNGGTVTAITRTNSGAGYTSFPTVSISAPTVAGGVQAVLSMANTGLYTSVATIQIGGTGYTLNDIITVVGGTPTGGAATYTVTGVSANVITSVTPLNYASYLVLPSNPVSITGGTGNTATLNLTYGIQPPVITTAGSGYVEQPTVTFSGGGGSGAAAYATIGGDTTIRGLGRIFSLNAANSGIGLQVYDATGGSGTSGGYWRFAQNYGTTALMVSNGSNASISTGGIGNLSFFTNTVAQEQFRVSHTSSAVNYVAVNGAATGGAVYVSAQGSDTNIPLIIQSKGTQPVYFATGGGIQFAALNTASSVNYVYARGGAAGSAAILAATGNDTNVDLALTPKGTGAVLINSILGLNAVTASTTATTAAQVLATFDATLYRTVKFVIQANSNATNYSSTEILAIHNGTTASYTEYATVTIGTACAVYSVDYSSATIRLLATPASATATTYKIAAQLTRI